MQTATGLHFVDDGPTAEKTSKDRKAYQPALYSSARWAPVLVWWSYENTTPALAGYVAGFGMPQAVYASRDRLVYVTGQLTLDRRQLSLASAPTARWSGRSSSTSSATSSDSTTPPIGARSCSPRRSSTSTTTGSATGADSHASARKRASPGSDPDYLPSQTSTTSTSSTEMSSCVCGMP